MGTCVKNKPNNISSFVKKRHIKKAKEILEKEFELIDLIDSAGNDPVDIKNLKFKQIDST